jgi:protein NEDD1
MADSSGTVLATAGGEDAHIWHFGKPGASLEALSPSSHLPPMPGGVTALSWTTISNSLAAASARGTISLFSQGGAPLETMSSKDVGGDGERIKCLSFAAQSLSLCSGGSSAELKVWDCKRREVVKTYHGHKAAISACAYGDKDMLLASGSTSGDILVHMSSSPSTSDEPQRIKNGAGKSSCAIRTVKFSPFRRSHLAAAGEEAVVELYDTARSDAPSLAQFTQHTGTVTGLAFSPVNELLLCSAGLDCRAHFYDVQTKKLVKSVTCGAP